MRLNFVLFLFILINTVITAQISPGKLSSAHAKLEGMSNCTKCHVLRDKVENKLCLDCHKEINTLIQSKRGFHSTSDVTGKNCFSCHGEHFGREFKILNFDKDNFDHNKTTFKLSGKHAELKCNECHQRKFIKSADLKKRDNTFLGLTTNCTNCHEDFHQGTLEEKNCLSCHNTVKWRPAQLFEHDKTKFKLQGAHKELKCEKCHAKSKFNGKDFQKFVGIKFNKCTNCHKDFHKGRFGSNCLKCHTTISFGKVKNLTGFNHSKTRFPLKGKHKSVECSKCHTSGFKKKLKFQSCTNCHKDQHSRQLLKDGKIKDCAQCHNVNGFSPSTFSIEEHNNTNFVLAGSHLAIPCSSCHLKNGKNNFKFINNNCETCHKNKHGNRIEKFTLNGNTCVTCHNVTAWHDVKFDHNKTDFSLSGKHKIVECSKCHFKNESQNDKIFTKLSRDCTSCHEDFHNGQFVEDFSNDCTKCHVFDSWKPEKFEHSITKFKLTGAHEGVACEKCHSSKIVNGKKQIKFKLDEISCETCHK